MTREIVFMPRFFHFADTPNLFRKSLYGLSLFRRDSCFPRRGERFGFHSHLLFC